MKPFLKLISILIPLLLTSGCESVSYYYQAIEGQLSIIKKRTPIESIIQDPNTTDGTAKKLSLVLEARKFAQEKIGLEVGEHYSQYVALDRSYVVWNVFAAPEFSIQPITWCYPIAGCVAYKGYFNEADALAYAEKLQNDGYETYVGGVAAYSTLGWFEDPVLSTFLRRSDASLVGLLIHELAHQELYVENDSAFNESFATTVEILGLNEWLTLHQNSDAIPKLAKQRQRKSEFISLVLNHREHLANIYNMEAPEAKVREKRIREAKQAAIEKFRADYQALKESWGGYSGYDNWFSGPLNNAQISTIATYHHWVDSFMAIFHQENQNWRSFFKRCHEIAQLNREVRDQTLEKLSVEGRKYRL